MNNEHNNKEILYTENNANHYIENNYNERNKTNSKPKEKNKKKMAIIPIILFLLNAIFTLFIQFSPTASGVVEKRVNEYLSEKYNEEFTVITVDKQFVNLLDKWVYVIYLEDSLNIQFEVYASNKIETLDDNYLNKKIQELNINNVKEMVSNLIPNTKSIIYNPIVTTFDNNKKISINSYNDVFKYQNKEIDLYENIDLYISDNYSIDSKKEQKEGLLKLYDYYEDLGVDFSMNINLINSNTLLPLRSYDYNEQGNKINNYEKNIRLIQEL